MLDKNEIESMYGKISLDAARLATDDAKLRLTDALDLSKSLEQKAFTVLGVYITITIAIFGILTRSSFHLGISLFVSGSIFYYGIIRALLSLKSSNYGCVGSSPDVWVREGVINGDDNSIALNLTYIARDYLNPIEESDQSNQKKAKNLNHAIISGSIAPLFFILVYTMVWVLKYLFLQSGPY